MHNCDVYGPAHQCTGTRTDREAKTGAGTLGAWHSDATAARTDDGGVHLREVA
jgi:hypothetical protein